MALDIPVPGELMTTFELDSLLNDAGDPPQQPDLSALLASLGGTPPPPLVVPADVVAAARARSAERMLAFCMSQHQRLGGASPARFLLPELLQLIFEHAQERWTLHITKQEVHRAEQVNGSKRYSISTLKSFGIEVALADQLGRPVLDNVPLEVSLLFESGLPVPSPSPFPHSEPPLQGDAEAMTTRDGRASFRLRLGYRTLSSTFGDQLFRVRIALKGGAAADALAPPAISEPFRSVVRLPLRRRPAPPAQPAPVIAIPPAPLAASPDQGTGSALVDALALASAGL